ncbi:MAG TPA: two-component regulator propeller domain-containing protein, partial [Fibrella sp.]
MRLLYLFLLLPFTLFAQLKGWQELTISDGLSQGMIFDLAQDKQGFIWVATKDGLNRYDGHNFTVFTHDTHNAYSLSDNNCSALLVDRRGWLWVGTLNQGLNLFDPRSQRFYHLDIRDQASPNTANYVVNYLYEDPEGTIWVNANYDKLIKIHLSDALKTGFPNYPKLDDQVQLVQISVNGGASNLINHVGFRPDGQALAVSLGGLTSFNWKHPEKATRFDPFPAELAENTAAYGDVTNGSWFSAVNNRIICRWQGKLKTIHVPKKEDAVVSLKAINSVTLAIATDEFLWLMSPDELGRQDSLTARNA